MRAGPELGSMHRAETGERERHAGAIQRGELRAGLCLVRSQPARGPAGSADLAAGTEPSQVLWKG